MRIGIGGEAYTSRLSHSAHILGTDVSAFVRQAYFLGANDPDAAP
jgi:hypothetical protein